MSRGPGRLMRLAVEHFKFQGRRAPKFIDSRSLAWDAYRPIPYPNLVGWTPTRVQCQAASRALRTLIKAHPERYAMVRGQYLYDLTDRASVEWAERQRGQRRWRSGPRRRSARCVLPR